LVQTLLMQQKNGQRPQYLQNNFLETYFLIQQQTLLKLQTTVSQQEHGQVVLVSQQQLQNQVELEAVLLMD